ncbi:hypothetical protein DPMN_045956 [Dreissena polymorpha]|uniref:Uncharacterized protein n=1 Tax=Dreissena polymorpha TaxID=45954 RepID=A0A9D4D523_DREPO|nr:hypothetical protein DPMN_045956 [Dreissena polymorpha]
MGVVKCDILFLGASTDQTFSFTSSSPNPNNLSIDNKSRVVSKTDIIAGWHYVSVKCENKLPATVGTTVTTLTLTQFLVENPVRNLALYHNSANITFHPFSNELKLNVSLSPSTSPNLENLTCVFKIKQDSIETINVSGNVLVNEHISYSHKFALGNRNTSITVNCSNIQTSQVLTLEAFVFYDCWLDSKYFHSGREQSAPVAAYTDEDKEV